MSDVDVDNIVRLASLSLEIKTEEDHPEVASFEEGLAKLDHYGRMAVLVVSKLLQGKPYEASTDNPTTISWALKLAKHMSAAVSVKESANGKITTIRLEPPLKQ